MDMKAFMAEKMTEALLRECPRCKKKFYKEEVLFPPPFLPLPLFPSTSYSYFLFSIK